MIKSLNNNKKFYGRCDLEKRNVRMYQWLPLGLLIILLPLVFSSCLAHGVTEQSKPLMWNIGKINELKNDTLQYYDIYQNIIKTSNEYVQRSPIVITSKKKSFVSDKHYYCSLSIYYWPDTINPSKYVRRDGYKNPEYKEYDLQRLSEFARRCQYLSIAYYLTHDDKYYEAYIEQIKAWFIYKDTNMYPSFRYSQVIPGLDNNKGRSSGLIESYEFNNVLESLRLVQVVKQIDSQVLSELKRWFLLFINSIEDDYGHSVGKLNNNIGLAYDVTLINMYLFSGEIAKARKLYLQFADKWLYKHIEEDGSQPLELKRASGFSYSVYNLTHILDFCFIAHYWKVDFYKTHQERIDMAFSFLEQYEKINKTNSKNQTTEWNNEEKKFLNQKLRRERLRNKCSVMPTAPSMVELLQ